MSGNLTGILLVVAGIAGMVRQGMVAWACVLVAGLLMVL